MGLTFTRDFYTNKDYQEDIRNVARLHLAEIPVHQPVAAIFPEYEIKDTAERVALAALASIAEMENAEMLGKDNAYREDYVDRVAEIIRQGMAPSSHDAPVLDAAQFDTQPVEMNKPLDLFERAHVKWGLERWDGVQGAFMTAEKWACRTDLTERERCHGVAHDVYHQAGTRVTLDRIGQDMPVNPGQDYANFYEGQFGSQIRSRTMRAALDLFKD
jgi:hypothetical protein